MTDSQASKISCRLLFWLDDGQERGKCLIWRSLFEGGCCCQVVTRRWVIFWWIKAERESGINAGEIRGVLARESTVSLPCIPLWLGIQIKITSSAREASKVWMRESMGWGACVLDSAVRGQFRCLVSLYGWGSK